jgi:hypothetical protein
MRGTIGVNAKATPRINADKKAGFSSAIFFI